MITCLMFPQPRRPGRSHPAGNLETAVLTLDAESLHCGDQLVLKVVDKDAVALELVTPGGDDAETDTAGLLDDLAAQLWGYLYTVRNVAPAVRRDEQLILTGRLEYIIASGGMTVRSPNARVVAQAPSPALPGIPLYRKPLLPLIVRPEPKLTPKQRRFKAVISQLARVAPRFPAGAKGARMRHQHIKEQAR